jgi:hypothetical protein
MPFIGIGVGIGRQRFAGGGVTPYVGLLDDYPDAAAAYSLRLLKSDYTGDAIRVRRTNLDEMDIGFDALGNLDTSALLAFTGTGASDNGFVTEWFDQSGNARNATQVNAIFQPQIVSGGAIINENSKPTIKWDNVIGKLLISPSFTGGAIDSSFSVVKLTTQGSAFMDGLTTNNISFWSTATPGSFRVFAGVVDVVSNIFNINTQSLMTAIVNGSSSILKVNSTEVTGRNFGTNVRNGVVIGGLGSAVPLDGNIQEIIIYPNNQYSNSSAIQNNINDFYSIY